MTDKRTCRHTANPPSPRQERRRSCAAKKKKKEEKKGISKKATLRWLSQPTSAKSKCCLCLHLVRPGYSCPVLPAPCPPNFGTDNTTTRQPSSRASQAQPARSLRSSARIRTRAAALANLAIASMARPTLRHWPNAPPAVQSDRAALEAAASRAGQTTRPTAANVTGPMFLPDSDGPPLSSET